MTQRVVVTVVLCLMVLSACASSGPSTTQGSSQAPVSSTPTGAGSTASADGQEVKETGCDLPVTTVQSITRQAGEYRALLEVRRSDNPRPDCKGLYWARATPELLPADDRAKEVVTVLRMSDAGSSTLPSVAGQKAQQSDAMQSMFTVGRLAKSGQRLQACLEWPYRDRPGSGSLCTSVYQIP